MLKVQRITETVKKHPFLAGMLILQIGILVYLNLFKLDHYLGYDCSSYYLQAIEMWKQKTLFPDNWIYQTTLLIDSPVLLAAGLYGIFENIFTAYGVSLIVLSMIFIAIVLWALRQLKISIEGKLLALVILLTPFAGYAESNNNLSYYPMMFFSHGAYIVKIGVILLICVTFLTLDQRSLRTWKTTICVVLSVFGCFLCGFSSGIYILVFGVAPVAMYYVVRGVWTNKWRVYGIGEVIFIIACAGAQIAGKTAAKILLGFESKDSGTILTALDKFWGNFESIFLGFLKLLGALPTSGEVQVLSNEGIGFLARLGITALLLIGGTVTVVKSLRKVGADSPCAFWSVFLLIDIATFIPIYTVYGAAIFEERYLIPAFVVIVMLFCRWNDEQKKKENSSYIVALTACIVATLAFTNIDCFKKVRDSQNNYSLMQSIKECVEKSEVRVVYMLGPDVGILGRNMRVFDSSRIYKYSEDGKIPHHWGDYTYCDENSEYNGPTLLVSTKPFFETLPEYYTSKYKMIRELDGNNICIFRSDENPIDFATGIYDDTYNIDFPYSVGICTNEHGTFNENGEFISDGTEWYATWGPYYTITEEGVYDFTLNYEVVDAPSDNPGVFDVAINFGGEVLGQVAIDQDHRSITINNVALNGDMLGAPLEYRVFLNQGAVIKIKSFEIKNVTDK